VAEDNATNREVILAQLRKLGYTAEAVANGAEAIDAVQSEGYDLVLMDCEMPVMDGYEATSRIRQSNQPRMPIIALTASAMASDRDRCLSEGMNDHLAKPVELPRLAEVLAKWMPANGTARVASGPMVAGGKKLAIFDVEALLRRLMGDKELASAVLKGFLADAPSQFKQLRAKLDQEDTPGTRLQAHALKGAAATVGAEALYSIALAMETAASAKRLDSCCDLLPQASDEFEIFRQTVKSKGWA
jgi:CheY-like chemotaxis protein/HPt (histidine-containing phosphotransfer) domain-containing protein